MSALDGRELPAWFDDAKLGIFIHWTAAAIPAFAPVREPDFFGASTDWAAQLRDNPYVEWYQNSLAIEGSPAALHHAEHHGDLPYDAFVEQFRANLEGWDPEPWAELFASAGARYVVLVTKHHDGFCLWPTAHANPHRSGWHSERDVVGELAAAVRARGMRFGTYYSGGLDWTFGGTPITDLRSLIAAIPQDETYLAYADAHWRELVERYEPCVLWNDIGYPAAADLEELFEWYLDRVPDGVVNNRFDMIRQTSGQLFADFVTPEYSTSVPAGRKWEACRGIGTSFGFNRQESEASYLSTDELVHLVADITARGGNLLLNVGPTGAGEIPFAQAQRLLALGWWLRVNGDAIHGTRPWLRPDGTTGDGLDVRYTASADAVHAIVLGSLPGPDVVLDLVLEGGADVRLHGHHRALPWEEVPGGSRIDLPERPAESPAFALQVTPRDAVRPAQ
jgi:alpha-L-fucosidase